MAGNSDLKQNFSKFMYDLGTGEPINIYPETYTDQVFIDPNDAELIERGDNLSEVLRKLGKMVIVDSERPTNAFKGDLWYEIIN